MNRRFVVPVAFLSLIVAACGAQATAGQSKPHTPTGAIAGNIELPKRGSPGHDESWTALPLAKSGLNPSSFDATVLSKVDEPDYTSEIIHVQWRADDPIDLYVIRPHGVAKPPVILYLYDYTSTTARFRDKGWCERMTKNGFAAVGFVSALSGQRFHEPRLLKEWFVSDMQEALTTSAHDVQMVVNYLETRDDLDAKTVGMFAQGSGGAIAVLAASVDPRIVALDLFNPWGDWPDWIKGSRQIPENERANYLKPEFLQSISTLDPVTYLPELKLKSLRVQQITDDPVTPPAAQDKIAAAVPKRDDLARYKTPEDQERVWRAAGLNGWLRQQMRPATPQTPMTVATVAGKQ